MMETPLLKDITVAKAAVCAGQSSVFTMSKRVWLLEQMEAGVWLLLFCPGGGQVVTAAAQREMSSPNDSLPAPRPLQN